MGQFSPLHLKLQTVAHPERLKDQNTQFSCQNGKLNIQVFWH